MFGYGSRPGVGFGALVISALALTIVGVPLYLMVFSHGWSALSAMPYAIPIAAVAVAMLVAVGKRSIGILPVGASVQSVTVVRRVGYRRGSPGMAMVVGLGIVAMGCIASFQAGKDSSAYDKDASCAAGFALEPEHAGSCRLEQMRIVDAWTSRGRGARRHFTLERSDGTRVDAQPASDRRGNVWDGVLQGDRLATVQFYNDRPMQVETQAGLVTTSALPREREKFWSLIGLIGGAVGLLAAVGVLVRGIF